MFHEHLNKMNKKEREIMDAAVKAFQRETGLRAEWAGVNHDRADNGVDGELDIFFDQKPLHFKIEIKTEIRPHHLDRIVHQNKVTGPLIVVAEYIQPKAKTELQQLEIGYIETTGNVFLRRPRHFILIDTKRETIPVKEVNRAFTKTGLKVIFLFLQDETFVRQPYRTIAAKAGVGLGNVNHIMNGLKAQRILVLKGNDQYFIADKTALLDKWLEAYELRLKPTLHLGNYRFTNREDFFRWNELALDAQKTAWGGEPAGDIYTDYLKPETLTLYTEESKAELMKKYRLIPDAEGNINVYEKFWQHTIDQQKPVVPPLLAYTDLMNTGNQRCIDTAKKIYEEYLKNKFESSK